MAKARGSDLFANLAVITAAESVAGTLKFQKLETGISLFEKLAWVIHRVEYTPNISATLFNGTGDAISMGLSTTDQLTAVAVTNAAVLDMMQWFRQDWGTAASMVPTLFPFWKDFTMLPGGGLIVPPNPLYGFIQGVGLASTESVVIRIFYTTKELAADEYWELVEARRIIAS